MSGSLGQETMLTQKTGRDGDVFWLLDTRHVWNGSSIDAVARESLVHLSEEERQRARAFYFLKDAKLSVGASLLKRLFIVLNTAASSWSDVVFARRGDSRHGKPCYAATNTDHVKLDFNVSHQAGLVALAGCLDPGDEIGVDIVCVDERDNSRMIQREGFEAFVNMHREVFSDADLRQIMKPIQGSNAQSTSTDEDAGLRKFYAFWCIKEAYVKMVGEGLLDPWIRDVELRNVTVPLVAQSKSEGNIHVESVPSIEVWVHGRQLRDVHIWLQAFEGNYMIATAKRVKPGSHAIYPPKFQTLDLEVDVLHCARLAEGV
ncbi:MAG: hypothetical protein M1828_000365 [Chrysothrix sp. TS-e1954]|nr:MAG: hypothetical protein M1828_000365 [Chrysothrix sp. TS-e1954]